MKKLIDFINASANLSIFEAAINFVESEGRSAEIRGAKASDFSSKYWPKVPGVYIMRTIQDKSVLYVGMTGKIGGKDGGEVEIGGGRLDQRANRWTPYAFQKIGSYKDHLEFGPNFGNTGGKPPPMSDDNYRFHLPLASITVQCLDLSEHWRDITPTFLESFLLQAYLSERGCLPIGNQEF